ncbi:uncharacterized protein LAESUDRAFT_731406 [Laetiporus sulphureus 93-53]|uniref:Uncharacterized protein n=1 Tax=Laetiporus sulphureus 93-53 TaxID=1314785 RepID=A0A165BJV8_9APHY|nr:uncharacterized protein LAESUDRAFT_731406 [Laetiporus sulphureus 93-53]KZT01195.1 hypothetical protein LAESUDRAFT_731406 [Laetiporus sulphureus 93-53]
MPGIVPSIGTYLAIRLDSEAMVKHFEDAELSSAARAMDPKLYIGYVAQSQQPPLPNRPTHQCQIAFVGQGLPQRSKDEFTPADMCVPIFPNTEHPLSRDNLRPSTPFPFPNCYQYNSVQCTVRIPTAVYPIEDGLFLPHTEVSKHDRYAVEDVYRRMALRDGRQSGLGGNEGTFSYDSGTDSQIESDLLSNDRDDRDNAAQVVHRKADSASHLASDDVSAAPLNDGPPSGVDSSSLEGSSRPESITPPDTEQRQGDVQSDDDSAVSTIGSGAGEMIRTFTSSNIVTTDIIADEPGADPDVVPLVQISLKLSEVDIVRDPSGFLDEVAEIVQLIKAFREREQHELATRSVQRMHGHTDSSNGSWVDVDSYMASLMNNTNVEENQQSQTPLNWQQKTRARAARAIRNPQRTAEKVLLRVRGALRSHLCLR